MKIKSFWIQCVVIGLGLIFVISLPALSAPLVEFTEAPESGAYRYEFTLFSSAPSDNIYELFLDVAENLPNVSQVVAPMGWGSLTDPSLPGLLAYGDNGPGRTFIDAISDPGYELFGLGKLSGFGFTSVTKITQPILFSWNFDPANTGQAQPSTSVPEPRTFLLLVSGLFVVAAGHHEKRSRS